MEPSGNVWISGETVSNGSLTSPTISSNKSSSVTKPSGAAELIQDDGDVLAVVAELLQQLCHGNVSGAKIASRARARAVQLCELGDLQRLRSRSLTCRIPRIWSRLSS